MGPWESSLSRDVTLEGECTESCPRRPCQDLIYTITSTYPPPRAIITSHAVPLFLRAHFHARPRSHQEIPADSHPATPPATDTRRPPASPHLDRHPSAVGWAAQISRKPSRADALYVPPPRGLGRLLCSSLPFGDVCTMLTMPAVRGRQQRRRHRRRWRLRDWRKARVGLFGLDLRCGLVQRWSLCCLQSCWKG
jgi:hypothetical protein